MLTLYDWLLADKCISVPAMPCRPTVIGVIGGSFWWTRWMPVSEKRNAGKAWLKGRRGGVKETQCSKSFIPQTCLEMWHSIPLICHVLFYRQRSQPPHMFLQAKVWALLQKHLSVEWNWTAELGSLARPVPLNGPQGKRSPCSQGLCHW